MKHFIVLVFLYILAIASCDNPITKEIIYKKEIVAKPREIIITEPQKNIVIKNNRIIEDSYYTRKKKKLLVLNMNGGGIKGILQIQFLQLLEKELIRRENKTIYDTFDWFTGASIGGLHAFAYGLKKSTSDDIMAFYDDDDLLKKVFKTAEDSTEAIKKFSWNIIVTAGGLFKINLPKYKKVPGTTEVHHKDTYKPKFLKKYFFLGGKDLSLKDVAKHKHIIVSAYRMNSVNSTFYFSTIDLINSNEASKNIAVADIVDASTAVPNFFPIKQINIGGTIHEFIDGVLVDNNLSSTAIDVALKKGYCYNEIKILSLGAHSINPPSNSVINDIRESGSLDLLDKANLMEILFMGHTKRDESNAKMKIGENNFIHIPFNLDRDILINEYAPDKLEYLKKAAVDVWNTHKEKVLRLVLDIENEDKTVTVTDSNSCTIQ